MTDRLVFAAHTRKWEMAHVEKLDLNGVFVAPDQEGTDWWVRASGSAICKVGDEIDTLPLPPPPRQKK